MSWSDVFPILTDEHVEQFRKKASAKERALYDSYFGVKRIFNARPGATHILSTSLFWKNIREEMPAITITGRKMFMKANKNGLLRFDPWNHYTAPLLKGAHWLSRKHPEAVFRVYLAADLEFLIPDLTDAGCEVYLMKSNSLAHNPGAMWRMLAFEEEGKLVTILDSDRAARPGPDVLRTVELERVGLGWWRVPVWGELNEVGNMHYRPMIGCQMGTNRSIPAGLLMRALIWHTTRGTIDTFSTPPGCKRVRVHGSIWPDYGFDEWFLLTAVYPRAAFDGFLTFVPAEARSRLLPLDIEYAQWANPDSELAYFGAASGTCCAPEVPAVSTEVSVASAPVVQPSVLVRPDSLLIVKEDRGNRYPFLPAGVPRHFTPETPGGAPWLAGALAKNHPAWLISFPDSIVPAGTGAELFLDRRFEECDVAFTSAVFQEVPPGHWSWAARQYPGGGSLVPEPFLKLPGLNGALTLWRSAFAKEFLKLLRLHGPAGVSPEFLLWLLARDGKARVVHCGAESQGWSRR